jgi:hypothetical protein
MISQLDHVSEYGSDFQNELAIEQADNRSERKEAFVDFNHSLSVVSAAASDVASSIGVED